VWLDQFAVSHQHHKNCDREVESKQYGGDGQQNQVRISVLQVCITVLHNVIQSLHDFLSQYGGDGQQNQVCIIYISATGVYSGATQCYPLYLLSHQYYFRLSALPNMLIQIWYHMMTMATWFSQHFYTHMDTKHHTDKYKSSFLNISVVH